MVVKRMVLAKVFILLVLVAGTALLWVANLEYPHPYLERGFYSLLVFSFIFFAFKMILEEFVAGKISEPKARYLFRKTSSFAYLGILLLALITVWVPNPEALLVAYGVLAAGIAIAIQDLFKNVAGGLILLFTRSYTVGDRIEIGGRHGDVIDVGLLYTTLLETKEWVDGDQATGRLTSIPNHNILSTPINNYTRDNEFIWDEIKIPLTYDSDWRKASKMVTELVAKETGEVAAKARKELKEVQEKYYLTKREVDPKIYLTITDNWIDMKVRYVTNARERRLLHARLSRLLLERIEKSKGIRVASATFDIVGFPEVRIKQKRG
jgi:small-conductance mechanosensitive channel